MREAAPTAQPITRNVTTVANATIGHPSAERRKRSHKDPVVRAPLADIAHPDPRNVRNTGVTGRSPTPEVLPGPDLRVEDHLDTDRHPEMENDTNTKRRLAQ